ncbi:MAG: WecB/TagA/CpsF family glycosyltransferase [Candidatus Gracilibacteria bacterium]|jgi:N-acetylglucosaminyldiphosphoundecaprenol N-acetyl-beta-D-mannosaminyltransferase|nr:WecB/TagA/CpsF family glycosyltransferase [Candidatus Gracilibacteria bacterium]MDD5179360.1 WecB/TagA/CpsF family glycosyltransferase [Candidatus Gracilibacteria bacterium]
MPRSFVAGIGFDAVNSTEAVSRVENFLSGRVSLHEKARSAWGSMRAKTKFFLVTPNPEMVIAAQTNSAFKKILNTADLAVADGIGILWGSYFLHLKRRNFFTLLASLFSVIFHSRKIHSVLPERVTGVDLFPRLLEVAARRKKKVFLLGAASGVAEKVKAKMEARIEGLEITGVYAGSPAESEAEEIFQRIEESEAEMLFVAYGAPAQEMWIARYLPHFKKVKFAAGIGGAFDFHAGLIARSPRFLRALGLEWLWRLIRQPSRFPRIWNATFRFISLVWRSRKV